MPFLPIMSSYKTPSTLTMQKYPATIFSGAVVNKEGIAIQINRSFVTNGSDGVLLTLSNIGICLY